MTKLFKERTGCPACGAPASRSVYVDGSEWCFRCHTGGPSDDRARLLAVKYLLDFKDSDLLTRCRLRVEAARSLLRGT